MNKKIKLAVIAALALSATSSFATNGDHMIGQGAKSRAMGGVGIAKSFGAESSLANPALLNTVKNKEFSAAVTVFMPDVQFKSNAMSNADGRVATPTFASSEADLSYIPELYFASRINNNLVYGISISGTAGMGTDYEHTPFMAAGNNGSFQMQTALGLMKIAVPFAYSIDKFTIGVSPILQYGTLEMRHLKGDPTSPTGFSQLNNGKASDTAFGYELGLAYDINKNLTLGAVYKSKLGMTYDNTIGSSVAAFGLNQAVTSGDNLEQPAEMGIGVSYSTSGHTLAVDYKNIAWGSAEGYRDFGWEDQDVVAVGYEFATSKWALRVGYNHSSSPIKEQNGAKGIGAQGPVNYAGAGINFFNLAGFPGMVESHYTIGGGYSISEALSLDVAVVYADENTNSFDTSAMTEAFVMQGAMAQGFTPQQAAGAATAAPTSSADVKHSQLGFTIAMTYKF